MPPPRPLVLFPLMVLLLMVDVPLVFIAMPPPKVTWQPWPVHRTLFPLTVLLLIMSVPSLNMPPPQARQKVLQEISAVFPLTVLLLTASVPALKMPPPRSEWPPRMVTFERLTWALALGIVTTVLTPRPSTIVVMAPAPTTLKLKLMVRFSG